MLNAIELKLITQEAIIVRRMIDAQIDGVVLYSETREGSLANSRKMYVPMGSILYFILPEPKPEADQP